MGTSRLIYVKTKGLIFFYIYRMVDITGDL